MVRYLWDRQADVIIDIKLGDYDADSYKYEPMVSDLSLAGHNQKGQAR